MARRKRSSGSQGATCAPMQSNAAVAAGFKAGIDNVCKDPISQYEVPALSGNSVSTRPGVWGDCCQKP